MSWQKLHIGDLGRVVTGKTPPTGNRAFYDGEYPFVTPTDLDWQSYVVRSTHSTVTELARDKNKNQFIPANATVFTCIGNTIGKTGLSAADCLTNQQINSVVPNDKHDPKFVYYLLNYHRPAIRSLGLGNGAAQPIINKSTFSGMTVATPDNRDEEQRISSVLSAYDDLIENNRRRIALSEQAARQLYKEWFVRFRFPGHEHVKIIDGVPEGWEQGNIGSFYATSSGGTPSRKIVEYFDGSVAWVKTGELLGGFVLQTEERITEKAIENSSAKIFPRHTVLVAMYGATIAQLGILAMPAASNQACCALMPRHKNANFAYAYLFLDQSKDMLIGLGKGSAQNNISQSTIRDFPMTMPSDVISSAFLETVGPIFAQIENLQTQNEKLIAARDLLLPKLMSGAIAV